MAHTLPTPLFLSIRFGEGKGGKSSAFFILDISIRQRIHIKLYIFLAIQNDGKGTIVFAHYRRISRIIFYSNSSREASILTNMNNSTVNDHSELPP
jgi:hypothetical protein